MKKIKKENQTFESIKHIDENGIESKNYGNLPFETELIINYIDVSEADIKIN